MNISILAELGFEEVKIDTGSVLIKEGEKTQNVYVLISGKVEITAKTHRIAMVDNPGTILGEVSVLLGTDPVATVTTTESSSFYVIEDFLDFLHAHPDACVSVSQILACRLINMNNHLVHVKEQIDELRKSLDDYVPVFPENFQK